VKITFSQIASVFLALLVVVSTTSFTISKHYCLGRLVKTTIVVENSGCDAKTSEQNNKSSEYNANHPCCDDVNHIVEGLEGFHFEKHQNTDFSVNFYFDVNSIHSEFIPLERKTESLYFSYKPPPLHKTIYQYNETYLI